MAEGNELMTGYLMGATDGNSNNGNGFGISGVGDLVALLVVAGLFGGGGWGFGGFGGGGGSGIQGMATRADITAGFQWNSLENSVRGIQQGLCDSTYALNNAIMSGFHGVDSGLCNLQHAISDCCCATQNAIQNVRYDMATQACDTRNLIQNVARDITDNQNANYRAMMDFLVQEKLAAKDATIAQLQQRDNLNEQSKLFAAQIDAAKAEILRRTGNDYPVASYLVQPPTALNFPTNGCGQVQFAPNNGGNCNGCFGFAA